MTREEFITLLRQSNATKRVIQSGMPQANEHERRSAEARLVVLQDKLAHAPWKDTWYGIRRRRLVYWWGKLIGRW